MANIKLQWPVDSLIINQAFGKNPDFYRPFGLPGHEGIDFFAPTNANIYAAADGEVFMSEHPGDHPYGLHVRIRHNQNGVTFRTVYAHLKSSLVSEGQNVVAGQRIGKADNTGNSFGSHLHFTLKIDGQSAQGFPSNIVDPTPFLVKPQPEQPDPDPDVPLPPKSGIKVQTSTILNMRSGPSVFANIVTVLTMGEPLEVLGEAAAVTPNIGKQGKWLHVLASNGKSGHVAAWFVEIEASPASGLVVYPIGTIDVRKDRTNTSRVSGQVSELEALMVLGTVAEAQSLIGQAGKFLEVRAPDGLVGFVMADKVRLTGELPPSTDLLVTPNFALNVRARPTTNANVLTVVMPGDRLDVLGDDAEAESKINSKTGWINIKTPSGLSGYVVTRFVKITAGAGQPTTPLPAPNELFVFPVTNVNVRAQASVNSPRVGGAFLNESLSVVETDLNAAKAKVGSSSQWIHLQLSNGTRGWILGSLLSLSKS
jgi:uncharacterized protein YgiM (DUF1202 family)